MKTALLSVALLAATARLAHADPEDAEFLFGGCAQSDSEMTAGCGTDPGTGEPTLTGCDVGESSRKRGSALPTLGILALVGFSIGRKRRAR